MNYRTGAVKALTGPSAQWWVELAATGDTAAPTALDVRSARELCEQLHAAGLLVSTERPRPWPAPVAGRSLLPSWAPIIWTRRVDAADLTDPTGLELTTHLLQEWIPKDYEVRLTVVGKHYFAVAIHAHSSSTRVDWRSDYDALTYTVIQVPADVAERAHAFLCASGLPYGAFDFIVTPDTGVYIFLECNAAGQWGWLAEECGLPIAEAIADELTGSQR